MRDRLTDKVGTGMNKNLTNMNRIRDPLMTNKLFRFLRFVARQTSANLVQFLVIEASVQSSGDVAR